MFAVAGIVTVISVGWRFSDYLADAANGFLTRDIIFLVMAYRLPGFLELILPISFFLAIMLAYGRLYVDSEMVILQACGMSTGRLIYITLLLSLFVLALTAAMTLWLKPTGESEVEKLLNSQQNMTEFDTLIPGRFQTLKSGDRVTYTERLGDDGRLNNLFISEIEAGRFNYGPKDSITVVAKTGESMIDANGNRFLVMRDGRRYNGEPGFRDFRVIEYEEYGQLIELREDKDPYERRTAIPTLDLIDSDSAMGISELQWRLAVILMVPVIALMAIPLARVNPRQGRFTRLLPGMFCCFLYVVILSAGRAALEKGQIPIGVGLWWVHGMFLVLVILLFNGEWFARPFRAFAIHRAVTTTK